MAMRKLLLLAAVFAATPAYAQAPLNATATAPTTAQQPAPAEEDLRSLFGLAPRQFLIGGRFSSVSGDPARWQRYEDLRDGVVLTAFRYSGERESNGQSYFVSADNV